MPEIKAERLGIMHEEENYIGNFGESFPVGSPSNLKKIPPLLQAQKFGMTRKI
jgi:hypothetical protein